MRPVAAARPDRRGAPQHGPRRRVGPAVRDRPALSRATPSTRRLRFILAGEKRPRGWQSRQGAGVRRVRCQGRSAGAARSRRRAGRQPAGFPRRRSDLASGPVGHARAWPEDHRRRFGELHPGLTRPRRAGRQRSPRKSTSTPFRRRARRSRAAAFAPPALQAITRDFAFIVPAELSADVWSARSAAPTRPRSPTFACSTASKPRTGCRSPSKSRSSRREELHRRGDRRDFAAHRRRGGEARRAPPDLVRAR